MALIKSTQVISQYLFKEIFINKKIYVSKWRMKVFSKFVWWLKIDENTSRQKENFSARAVWIYSIKNYHHHQSFSVVYSYRIYFWGQCHIHQINWMNLISFYMLSATRWIVLLLFFNCLKFVTPHKILDNSEI